MPEGDGALDIIPERAVGRKKTIGDGDGEFPFGRDILIYEGDRALAVLDRNRDNEGPTAVAEVMIDLRRRFRLWSKSIATFGGHESGG